jgi:hypothetical protein
MHPGITYGSLIVVCLALGACDAHTQDQRSAVSDKAKPAASDQGAATKAAPPKPLSTDAEVRTGERQEDKDKEPRGNTPPGMDRSGGGPASGAIVDPTGAATK